MAQMKVKLPAVLGILGADQPPRYVPVSRIRAAMKSTQFEEQAVAVPAAEPLVSICRLYPPASGQPGRDALRARRPKSPPASPRFSPRKDW